MELLYHHARLVAVTRRLVRPAGPQATAPTVVRAAVILHISLGDWLELGMESELNTSAQLG